MKNTKTAIFAGGCFWGMEYYMRQATGVINVTSGYTGGNEEYPDYRQVKSHSTGHAEAVLIEYDADKTDYRTLAKLFFEIHDPTQLNKQGIDIGNQYRSEIFYTDREQKQIAEDLISILNAKGYKVVTKITPASKFWNAEEYHQNYFKKNGGEPDCHFYTKRF